nr:helix-turn-helix transcriptional regulator [Leucobacter aridicollis]
MFQEPVAVRPRPEHVSAVESLTPRELEIAPLTATLSNREIADRLTLSIRTVENHIARSMKKLGLSSRKELSTALSSAAIAASGVGSD